MWACTRHSRICTVWETGELAVVQGVGYPDPNRSHFRSMEIWQTGTVGPAPPAGWLGRLGDAHTPLELCHVGQGSMPLAVQGRKVVAQSLGGVAAHRLGSGAELPSRFKEESGEPPLSTRPAIPFRARFNAGRFRVTTEEKLRPLARFGCSMV